MQSRPTTHRQTRDPVHLTFADNSSLITEMFLSH
jgi:hypothetical protein